MLTAHKVGTRERPAKLSGGQDLVSFVVNKLVEGVEGKYYFNFHKNTLVVSESSLSVDSGSMTQDEADDVFKQARSLAQSFRELDEEFAETLRQHEVYRERRGKIWAKK